MKSIAFSLVFVLSLEGLDRDVIPEGLQQVLVALHIQLDVCSVNLISEQRDIADWEVLYTVKFLDPG